MIVEAGHNGSIVVVGMFDGVHLGHRYLLERLVDKASALQLSPVVVTFSNHPLSVIRPEKVPAVITELDRKIALIKSFGIERVVVLEFSEDLRKLTAQEFARKILKDKYNAQYLLLGYDNGFGSDKLKTATEFSKALQSIDIKVIDCDAYPGENISSTRIRKALKEGNIGHVNSLMGHRYMIGGTVVSGRRIGRTIGFPTANISSPTPIVLPNGVYAAKVTCPTYLEGLPAMINIGNAPTVNSNDTQITVEANIIVNDSEKIGNLYGKYLSLEIIEKIRDEEKFSSLTELKEQLMKDRNTTLQIVHES